MHSEGHPIRLVVREQGRTLTWLARQLGISANYLHRILAEPGTDLWRPAPDWFYARCASVLQVPADFLRPADPDTREAARAA